LLSVGIISSTTAQVFNKAKMDSFFTAIERNNKGMGSVAITKNGKVVYTRSIGYSYINAYTKTHADYATKYRIGSITKMFTTTMIFQLIEEGKLTLNTPLAKFFPKIPNAKLITIGNLLNHRSGIHNFTKDADYLLWNGKAHTQSEMVAIITKGGSDFTPDSQATYSNSNFVLLGFIVEKITGKTYEEALEQRITSKIGLTNTYYGGKTNPSNREAFSYSLDSNWTQEPETDMSIPGGAGAILSTPVELDLFISNLFMNKLIKPASLEQMKTIKDKYGM
jgi:CubicO group peptidase (beta-lactamase class C family)